MGIFSDKYYENTKPDVEIKVGSKHGSKIGIVDESVYTTKNNSAVYNYESLNDKESKDPMAEPNVHINDYDIPNVIHYNETKNKLDKLKLENNMFNMLKDLNEIKAKYKNNNNIKELADTALASINDLKDSIYNDARFANINYDNTKRSINIVLSEEANEKLKNLILNKTSDLTKEDINKIEDIIEDKVIDYIEEREY